MLPLRSKEMKPYWMSREYAESYIKSVKESPLRKIYDEVCKEIILKIIRKVKAITVLDAGCGPGVYGVFLLRKRRKSEIVFLDINTYMLHYVKNAIGKYRIRAHLIQANINHLPFRNASFNIVLAEGDSLTQRQSRDEVIISLKEVHRVIKDGGTLLGSVSNVFVRFTKSLSKIRNMRELEQILEIINKKQLTLKIPGFEKSKIQLYTSKELRNLLSQIGFHNITLQPLIVISSFLQKTFIKKNKKHLVNLEKRLST